MTIGNTQTPGLNSLQTLKSRKGIFLEIVWTPNGLSLTSSTNDNLIFLWDTISGKICRVFEGHSGEITSLSWSRDEYFLASSDNLYNIYLWNPTSSELRRQLHGHNGIVTQIAFSSAYNILGSCSEDRSILI